MDMNRMLKGWSNYFKLGYRRKIFMNINYYIQIRFHRYTKIEAKGNINPDGRGKASMNA